MHLLQELHDVIPTNLTLTLHTQLCPLTIHLKIQLHTSHSVEDWFADDVGGRRQDDVAGCGDFFPGIECSQHITVVVHLRLDCGYEQ